MTATFVSEAGGRSEANLSFVEGLAAAYRDPLTGGVPEVGGLGSSAGALVLAEGRGRQQTGQAATTPTVGQKKRTMTAANRGARACGGLFHGCGTSTSSQCTSKPGPHPQRIEPNSGDTRKRYADSCGASQLGLGDGAVLNFCGRVNRPR